MHKQHVLLIQDEMSQQYLSSKFKLTAMPEVSPRNSMFEVASINQLSLIMTICAFIRSVPVSRNMSMYQVMTPHPSAHVQDKLHIQVFASRGDNCHVKGCSTRQKHAQTQYE